MDLKKIETGALRLYYVAWAFYAMAMLYGAFFEFPYPTNHLGMPVRLLLSGVFFVILVCIPWIALRAFKWVYRGFVPKAA